MQDTPKLHRKPLKRVAIFDMDGTLSDCEHRRHHVSGDNKDWKSFFAEIHNDLPKHHIVELARFYQSDGYHIFICTGRNAAHHKITERWLIWNNVPFNRIYMRDDDDQRPDHEVKRDMLGLMRDEGFLPMIAVEDRDSVVKMWRQEGLTCLQVAEGDF